ncbi:MAG TPA: 50S ribosomal protein L11 methyltransferase, partial [Desulfomonilaceae bacterium]|nr:50S ribosomal protein L11 methyltransferase [Desulfomonilaceae bacterium]
GCGSGILAIAAAKLAATRVKAVDNDPVAVAAARKNAALNRVEDRIEFACSPIESEVESFDVVIANLDPMTLQANKDQLIRVSGTFLIISGVPVDQWNDIKTVFLSEKLVFGKEIVREEWGCGLFTKK